MLFIYLGIGNHVKSSMIIQASSDSELIKNRAKQVNDSLGNATADNMNKMPDPDGSIPSAKGIFLPNVQNMKHNVSEKVAQVGCFDNDNLQVVALMISCWLLS